MLVNTKKKELVGDFREQQQGIAAEGVTAAGARPRLRRSRARRPTAAARRRTRQRLWKVELQKLVRIRSAFPSRSAHLPPGTSKWNKIEHRVFAFITKNWRGKPLVSHQAIVN